MSAPRKFLFVCTGNTCRSLMAEKLFQKLSTEAGETWLARSCGLIGNPELPIPDQTRAALASQGIAKFFHQSTRATPELVHWADLVLCMSDQHVSALKKMLPQAAEKVKLLREHLGLYPPAVEDPIGRSDEVYRECLGQIREAVEALIKRYGTGKPAQKTGP